MARPDRRSWMATPLGLILVLVAALPACGDWLDEGTSSYDSGTTRRTSATTAATTAPNPVGFDATLEITRLACLDGEEDDYSLSPGDELILTYTILEIDRYGNAVRSSTHQWGYNGVQAGNAFSSGIDRLRIPDVPFGNSLVVTLNLLEVEDYHNAVETMKTVNRIAGAVSFVNTWNPEPYSKTAVEITAQILRYAGYAVDFAAWVDDDDELGDVVNEIDAASLSQLARSGGGRATNGWRFTGSNNWDDYWYEIEYAVHVSPTY